MIDLRTVLAVAIGSALGGSCRYLIGTWFVQRFGPGFPFGTLFINVSGSLLIGLVAELSQTRALGITPFVRVALATGFIGGYTTFSSYVFEAVTLDGEGRRWMALLYALGSVALGITAYFAGTILARLLTRAAT
jgi:fluoride exporter